LKIVLLWVGRTRNASLQTLIQDYRNRISHFCELKVLELQPVKTREQARVIVLEGERMLAKVASSDFLVLVDPAGQSQTTEKFATFISKQRDQPIGNLVFAVGGHAGFSEAVKRRTNLMISLSPMTFTHEMARCLLVERIYRAFSILHHFPYHK
jgi:23S rRNA (pseudouridine1915-N3)-methyltransferase